MKRILSLLLLLSLAACGAAAAPPERETALAAAPPAAETVLAAAGIDAAQEAPSSPETPEEPEAPSAAEAPSGRTVDPSRPMVALTFDDGPHPTYTGQILDILEEHNAAATFFEVGRKLSSAPDAVRREAELGCEVGSHSYRHANLGKMSAASIRQDMTAADGCFRAVLGTAPTLLRPPYGSVNKALKGIKTHSLVTWSIDTEDWKSQNTDKVVAKVKDAGNLDGEVVLMHSTYASTVEAARILVPWLQEQGYQLVTVSELLTLRYGDTVDPGRLYGYSYFAKGVPALPEKRSEEPVEDLVLAEGKPWEASPYTVRLVMAKGVRETMSRAPGGAYGAENWRGSCVLQVLRDGAAVTELDLPSEEEWVFQEKGFALKFGDYNEDGRAEFSVGQYGTPDYNRYSVFTLGWDGSLLEASAPLGVKSGPDGGRYSTMFENSAAGFAVYYYGGGKNQREEYRWDPDDGRYVPDGE